MPIDFACPGCSKPYSVRDDLAGRRVKCKACGGVSTVPTAIPAPDSAIAPVDLGIATDRPRPATKARRAPHDPMNAVGLASLLLGLASFVPAALAWVMVFFHFGGGSGPFAAIPILVYSGLGAAASGLGLLVASLSRQRIVRPFSACGLGVALIPLVLSLVALARSPTPIPLDADPPALAPAPGPNDLAAEISDGHSKWLSLLKSGNARAVPGRHGVEAWLADLTTFERDAHLFTQVGKNLRAGSLRFCFEAPYLGQHASLIQAIEDADMPTRARPIAAAIREIAWHKPGGPEPLSQEDWEALVERHDAALVDLGESISDDVALYFHRKSISPGFGSGRAAEAARIREKGAEVEARRPRRGGRPPHQDRLSVPLMDMQSTFGVDEEVPEPEDGPPAPLGSRVVLVDDLDEDDPERDVILTRSLDDLLWMHGGLRPEDLPELQRRATDHQFLKAPRGAIGRVVQVVEGRLPYGMRAVEVQFSPVGPHGWVADTFAR